MLLTQPSTEDKETPIPVTVITTDDNNQLNDPEKSTPAVATATTDKQPKIPESPTQVVGDGKDIDSVRVDDNKTTAEGEEKKVDDVITLPDAVTDASVITLPDAVSDVSVTTPPDESTAVEDNKVDEKSDNLPCNQNLQKGGDGAAPGGIDDQSHESQNLQVGGANKEAESSNVRQDDRQLVDTAQMIVAEAISAGLKLYRDEVRAGEVKGHNNADQGEEGGKVKVHGDTDQGRDISDHNVKKDATKGQAPQPPITSNMAAPCPPSAPEGSSGEPPQEGATAGPAQHQVHAGALCLHDSALCMHRLTNSLYLLSFSMCEIIKTNIDPSSVLILTILNNGFSLHLS